MTKLEEETCEVCHKPWNYSQVVELKEKYKDTIYIPGEELDFENLTDEQKSERRREIEEFFNAQHPDPPGAEVTVAVETQDEVIQDEEHMSVG